MSGVNQKYCQGVAKKFPSKNWITLEGALGGVNFCSY